MSDFKAIARDTVEEFLNICKEFYKLEAAGYKNADETIKKFEKYKKLKSSNDDQEKLKNTYQFLENARNYDINQNTQKALFIYIHTIFERSIQKIIELNISNNKNVKERYFDFLVKKNKDLINKNKKDFLDSTFINLEGKDKIKKSFEYLPFVYQDLGQLRLLDNLLNVSESKNINLAIKWYYESRERRNLIVHRDNKIDNKYIQNIKLKRINIKNYYEEIFLKPDLIQIGKKVRVDSIYCHFIIHIMIRILIRYITYSDEENRESITTEIMHDVLESHSILKKNHFKNEFMPSFNLWLNADLYFQFKDDFKISEKHYLYFYANYGLTIKDMKSKKHSLGEGDLLEKWLKSDKVKKIFFKSNIGICMYHILDKKFDLAVQKLAECKDDAVLNPDGSFYWEAFYNWYAFRDLHNRKDFQLLYENLSGKKWDKELLERG